MPFAPEQLKVYDNWLQEYSTANMLALVEKGLALQDPNEIAMYIDVIGNIRKLTEPAFSEHLKLIDQQKAAQLTQKLAPIHMRNRMSFGNIADFLKHCRPQGR